MKETIISLCISFWMLGITTGICGVVALMHPAALPLAAIGFLITGFASISKLVLALKETK